MKSKQPRGKEKTDFDGQVWSDGVRGSIEETTKGPLKGAAWPLQAPWPGVPRK